MGPGALLTQAAFFVCLIFMVVARKKLHMSITFKSDDVGVDPVP